MRVLAGVLNTAQRLVINEYECDVVFDPHSSSPPLASYGCRRRRYRNPNPAACASIRRLDRDLHGGRHGLYPLYRYFERLHQLDVAGGDDTSSRLVACDRWRPSNETPLSADVSGGPVDGRRATIEAIDASPTAGRTGRSSTSRRRSAGAVKQCERYIRCAMRVWKTRSRDRFTNRFTRWVTVVALLDVFVRYVEFLRNFIVNGDSGYTTPTRSSQRT